MMISRTERKPAFSIRTEFSVSTHMNAQDRTLQNVTGARFRLGRSSYGAQRPAPCKDPLVALLHPGTLVWHSLSAPRSFCYQGSDLESEPFVCSGPEYHGPEFENLRNYSGMLRSTTLCAPRIEKEYEGLLSFSASSGRLLAAFTQNNNSARRFGISTGASGIPHIFESNAKAQPPRLFRLISRHGMPVRQLLRLIRHGTNIFGHLSQCFLAFYWPGEPRTAWRGSFVGSQTLPCIESETRNSLLCEEWVL
jgi:hypothetical protein